MKIYSLKCNMIMKKALSLWRCLGTDDIEDNY